MGLIKHINVQNNTGNPLPPSYFTDGPTCKTLSFERVFSAADVTPGTDEGQTKSDVGCLCFTLNGPKIKAIVAWSLQRTLGGITFDGVAQNGIDGDHDLYFRISDDKRSIFMYDAFIPALRTYIIKDGDVLKMILAVGG
jgi:hypothetical protein